MFALKQRIPIFPVGLGMQTIPVQSEETGFVDKVKVSFAEALPDKELFDPTACIKAGKNLNLVNSKTFGITEDSFRYEENSNSTPAGTPAAPANNEEN